MKIISIVILLIISNAQYTSGNYNMYIIPDGYIMRTNTKQDTIYINGLGSDSLCEIRGHIVGGAIQTTLMYCPDKIIEYEDSTVQIIHECNQSKSTCLRCGKMFYLPTPPDIRIVLWRRNP